MNTSSSGGLVRRRTAAEASADNNGSSTSSTNNDHNDNFNNDADNETEEASDKETRLTLMEEVLLLGLKDKEVSRHERNSAQCSVGNLRVHNPCTAIIKTLQNRESEFEDDYECGAGRKSDSDDDIWQFLPFLCVYSLHTHSCGEEISLAKVSFMLRSNRLRCLHK